MEIIRPARVEDALGIAHVHIDSWRTTYKGMVPDDYLANLSYERNAQNRTRILGDPETKTRMYVAQDDTGRIVGFVNGGPERENDPIYKSELYAIYLFKECQGRGLGRRLTQALVEGLLSDGMYAMLVWVLADNPSRRFYEALGGQELRTKPIEIGGATLEEVAYGWQDIRGLTNIG
ncbi:MAG TPA: GNAT family N-acetyltransferase [Ktedonobacteraceae bacterium]|nr:GNAT family N-acetyltransferase [Ktedonobacteraceae bacterium]